jgi:hypothetical protein
MFVNCSLRCIDKYNKILHISFQIDIYLCCNRNGKVNSAVDSTMYIIRKQIICKVILATTSTNVTANLLSTYLVILMTNDKEMRET